MPDMSLLYVKGAGDLIIDDALTHLGDDPPPGVACPLLTGEGGQRALVAGAEGGVPTRHRRSQRGAEGDGVRFGLGGGQRFVGIGCDDIER